MQIRRLKWNTTMHWALGRSDNAASATQTHRFGYSIRPETPCTSDFSWRLDFVVRAFEFSAASTGPAPCYSSSIEPLRLVMSRRVPCDLRGPFGAMFRTICLRRQSSGGWGATEMRSPPLKSRFPEFAVNSEAQFSHWIPQASVVLGGTYVEARGT